MRFASLAAAILVAALFVAPALAQSGVFDFDPAEFGTRPGNACGPFSEALADGPTGDEAAVIWICEEEQDPLGYGQQLYLYEAVVFTREAARQPTASEAMSLGFVLGSEVYPFTGTLTAVVCVRFSDYMQNEGKNCTETDQAGSGACFYTDRGVWHCYWVRDHDIATRYEQPPRIY